MNEKVNELIAILSDLSEEIWCAGWLHDCEHLFWNWLQYDHQVERYPELLEAKRLSEEIGGWVYWANDARGFPIGDGPAFIPMADWLKIHEAGGADTEATRRARGFGVLIKGEEDE